MLSNAAALCIDRFTTIELDFTTPNARGLGRMTDHVPRFAAKHRQVFASMTYDQLTELRWATKRHIICAYLFLGFMYQLSPVDESRYDNAKLFDLWVRLIYQPPRELERRQKAKPTSRESAQIT